MLNNSSVTRQKELSKVFFDRKTKRYVVRCDDQVLAHLPHGPENKLKAQWLAIGHDTPQEYQVARAMLVQGHDEGRLIQACRLLAEGRLIHIKRNDNLIEAEVKAGDGNLSPVTGLTVYHIFSNLIWTCTCRDYEIHGHGHRCKHSLAIQIATEDRERASGHYNVNLTDKARQGKLVQAQREQTVARKRLAKMNNNGQTPRGTHTGWYSAEVEEIAQYDPALAERMEQRAAAYKAALRPSPINKQLPNRNFNITRK